MTTLAPSLDVGEVNLKTDGLEFFGHVYVYYFAASLNWDLREFHGVMTQDGVMYRGRWTEGEDFEKLSQLFKSDPRMPELTVECIKRRVHYD